MESVNGTLKLLADKYETESFLRGDPSWYMHQVDGEDNKEVVAFVASIMSYGSRKQFLPKIQYMLECGAKVGSFYKWLKSGEYAMDIPDDENTCFYRLYTYSTMHKMLSALSDMINEYGTMKNYLQSRADGRRITGREAVEFIVDYFSAKNIEGIIPKNTKSSCKRICMFLRWMVRDNSPVDLGLWSDLVDKKTLIMPMDTHVLQEANRLGLMNSKSASMASAIKLTKRLREVFPEDPLKGDFALFGLGVDEDAF